MSNLSSDPLHPYTIHRTYTGPGCAHCGKTCDVHPQTSWLVDGKQVEPTVEMWDGEL